MYNCNSFKNIIHRFPQNPTILLFGKSPRDIECYLINIIRKGIDKFLIRYLNTTLLDMFFKFY